MARSEIKVGEFTVYLLSDGVWRNDGGCMFGIVPRVLWERDHPPDERNRITLGLTCPLVLHGRYAILADTGIGNRLSSSEQEAYCHPEASLTEGLRKLGLDPGDVTHVVLSHLHFDHFGGVVRRDRSGALKPAFPKATYIIQRGEYEIARNHPNVRLRAAYKHVEECLEPIKDAIELLDGTKEVIPGITALVTGGHTRDHQVVVVKGQDGSCFAHLADIVPTRSHIKPAWNQAYDLDPLRTMEEKARLLQQAAQESWWITFAHDEKYLAARLRQAGEGRIELAETVAVDRLVSA